MACAACAASPRRERFKLLVLLRLPVFSYAAWALGLWSLGAWALLQLLEVYYEAVDTLGFFGLCFTLTSWYLVAGGLSLAARALFLHVSAGVWEESLPRFSLNPFADSIALEMTALIAIAVAGWIFIDSLLLSGLLVTMLLPWAAISMRLEDGAFQGLKPSALLSTVTGLGPVCIPAFGLIGGAHVLMATTLTRWADFLNVALCGYVFLLAHALAGWLAFQKRDALSLITLDSPEQQVAFENQTRDKALDAVLSRAHRLCSVHRLSEAMALVDTHICEDYEALDPVVHKRLQQFHHPELLLEHAVHYLDRLIANRRGPRAWTLLNECLEREPRFRARSDSTHFAAIMAAEPNDVSCLLPLLERFHEDYPGSAHAAELDIHHAWVLSEWLNRNDESRQIIMSLLKVRPDVRENERVTLLLKRWRTQ